MNKRRKPSHGAAATASAPQAAYAQPDSAPTALAEAAYAPALNAGLQATASRVQEMHEAIAGKTFDNLLRVPGLSAPTRLVQAVHDAITQGVYAAVRHGGAAALTLAAGAERRASDPTRTPGGKEQSLRSALNGAVGDALAASGNPLAVQMSLHRSSPAKGQALLLQPDALASLRSRVCVFIHGLACDEGSWSLRTAAWAGSPWERMLPVDGASSYGDLLEREPLPASISAPVSAVWLRYNTGLPIEANAQQFAALLGDLLRAAPQVHDLVLVGHSMGGLVARRALAIAADDALPWAACVTMVICLGSPHQGAGLAKLGEIASAMLMSTEVTRPLGRIANARSQGVKDLRHGLGGAAAGSPQTAASTVPLRLVYATLGDAKDADGTPGGALLGKLFGDGLVHAASAADDGLTGDVQRVEITGLGHMGLLGDPRVYAQICRWLGAPELT
jgi:pimeloyl-ACP methyl ester carboxylesterase